MQKATGPFHIRVGQAILKIQTSRLDPPTRLNRKRGGGLFKNGFYIHPSVQNVN